MKASEIKAGDIVQVHLPNPFGSGAFTGIVREVFLSSFGNEHFDIRTATGKRIVARENHIVINYGPIPENQ